MSYALAQNSICCKQVLSVRSDREKMQNDTDTVEML